MSSPWGSPEQDPAVARLVRRQAPEVAPEPPLLRQRARQVVVVGAAIVIGASPLPWLARIGNPPPQTVTGWSGVADGFLLAVTAVALVALLLNREASTSRSPIFRWLPLLLAAVVVTLGVGALRSMENQVHIWRSEGAAGAYQPAFYIALTGAAILAAAAAWIGVRQVRDPARPGEALRPSRATLAWALFGGLGAIIGAGGVAVVILNSGLDPIALSLPLMIGLMIGAIAGGTVGARLSRGFSPRQVLPESSELDRVIPSSVRTRAASDERHDRDVR